MDWILNSPGRSLLPLCYPYPVTLHGGSGINMEVEKPSTLVLGSGNVAENWRKWKRRFEIYLEATGLVNATAIRKCATFKSVVGDDGLDGDGDYGFSQRSHC